MITKELKTLKEIEEFPITKEMWDVALNDSLYSKFASKEVLKQEAIKWVIEYQARNKKHADQMLKAYPDAPYGSSHYQDKIRWIKHFFNITEEDINNSGLSEMQKNR